MSTSRTLWLKVKGGLRLGFQTLLWCALLAPIEQELVSYIQATWAGRSYTFFILIEPLAYVLFFVLFFACYMVPFLVSGVALSLMSSRPVILKVLPVAAMSAVGSVVLNTIITISIGDASGLLLFHVLIFLIQAFLFLWTPTNVNEV